MLDIPNRRPVTALYLDDTSPIGHIVRIVLAEKNVSAEINYIDDNNRPESLNNLNPYNSLLTMVDRDLVLYDAQIIIEYLDERFPHPPLMPIDPIDRANNRQLRYRVMRDLYSVVETPDSNGKTMTPGARKDLRDNLTAIAPTFAYNPYFMSQEYSLVDCCMVPLMWRLTQYGIKLPASSAQHLQKYADRLFKRAAFKRSLSDVEKGYNAT